MKKFIAWAITLIMVFSMNITVEAISDDLEFVPLKSKVPPYERAVPLEDKIYTNDVTGEQVTTFAKLYNIGSCTDLTDELRADYPTEVCDIKYVVYHVRPMIQYMVARGGKIEEWLGTPYFIGSCQYDKLQNERDCYFRNYNGMPSSEFFVKYYDKGDILLHKIGISSKINKVYFLINSLPDLFIQSCIVYSTDDGEYFLVEGAYQGDVSNSYYFMTKSQMEDYCKASEAARETWYDYQMGMNDDIFVYCINYDLTPYQINEDDILNGIDAMDDYLIAGGASTTLAAVGSVTPAILLSKRRKKQKTEA